MSAETQQWLIDNIRIGYTDERGPAWWANDRDGRYLADGSHFPGSVPAEEVTRLLDVKFVSAQLIAQWSDDSGRQVVTDPDRQVIVTPDTGDILGVFKSGYQVHGYQEWTADQLAAIVDTARGELGVASVGLLRKRGVAFMQAKLEGSGMEVGGYGFVPFITAATSVDGSLSSTYATGVEGVVCDNTLTSALATATSKFKVKHSRKSAGKLAEVRDHLRLVYAAADEFTATAAALQDVTVSAAEFAAWLDLVAEVPAKDPKSSTGGRKYTNAVSYRDTLTGLWNHDPKVKPWAGTAFGIVQLDNTYRQWERNVSGTNRIERTYVNLVTGKTESEDTAALDTLARIESIAPRLAKALA